MSEAKGQLLTEAGVIVARTSPGALASAFTLNSVVAALTVIFLLLQIVHFLWKWRRERRNAKAIDLMMDGRIAKYGEKAPSSHRSKQDG